MRCRNSFIALNYSKNRVMMIQVCGKWVTFAAQNSKKEAESNDEETDIHGCSDGMRNGCHNGSEAGTD
jgi:hypothetical protein